MNRADEQWVHTLYAENAQKMFRIAMWRLNDEDAAHNAVHEVFLALLEKLEDVKKHPNPEGWLMKALRIAIYRELDARKSQTTHETTMDELYRSESAAPAYTPPLREMLPPGLTPQEQDLLVWHYEEGLGYEEISQRLSISILTCRTRMFRARAHYRKIAEEKKEFFELM